MKKTAGEHLLSFEKSLESLIKEFGFSPTGLRKMIRCRENMLNRRPHLKVVLDFIYLNIVRKPKILQDIMTKLKEDDCRETSRKRLKESLRCSKLKETKEVIRDVLQMLQPNYTKEEELCEELLKATHTRKKK